MINEKNYKEHLQGLCCVEISGESCANCLTLMPILKELIDARDDIRLVHVEADYSTLPLMEAWEVEKVPTILLVEDGEIFARCTGYQPEEILEIWLDAKIEAQKAKK
ncbi:MAG: thioredoxin family protein [Clostridia bacterium]|nr:thioredoxin family protein [Clostridia bacterium]MBQ7913675.1 thioredoxin family protein [Clostridia bacterium]